VAGYPGLSPEVLTYHQARIREELSGTGESLVVRVFGEDSAILTKKAEEVQKMLAGIRGIVNPTVQYPTEMPTLEIEVNVEKANQFGLKPGDVRRSAASLVSGIVVGSLFEEQKVFDVVVWGSPDIRHSLNSIRDLLIDRPNGPSVRLQDVADVRIVPGVSEIHRDAVARRVDVVAGVAGRDLSGVADEIDNGLEHINFPLEYRAELLGEFAERDRAEDRVLAFAAAAGLGMLLLLQAFFRSWRLAVLVFLTLPLALVGGLIVVMLTSGGLMTLGGMVAFIALFGISVRNSIMLVNRYRQLESTGEVAGVRLVQRATEERAVPIITTALATAFMFLPFAIAGTLPGLEFARPMALVVLGGLTTTTLLSLVAVPAFYLLVGGVREPDLGLEELPAVSKEVVAV
jgi:Cu/Ag efflux pump CusA